MHDRVWTTFPPYYNTARSRNRGPCLDLFSDKSMGHANETWGNEQGQVFRPLSSGVGMVLPRINPLPLVRKYGPEWALAAQARSREQPRIYGSSVYSHLQVKCRSRCLVRLRKYVGVTLPSNRSRRPLEGHSGALEGKQKPPFSPVQEIGVARVNSPEKRYLKYLDPIAIAALHRK